MTPRLTSRTKREICRLFRERSRASSHFPDFAGILLGILLRRTAIPGIAGRIFTPVVVLLLFAMGCAIGRNRTVMDNLPRLGLDAFILATASVAGSVIAVLLISRYLPRPGRGRETRR